MERGRSVCLLFGLLQLALVASANGLKYPKTIDVHCHYIPQFYAALLEEYNVFPGGLNMPEWSVTKHIEMMDRLNISCCIASVSTPGAVLTEDFPVNKSRAVARLVNEFGYNMTQEYSTRFKFYATLTLPDVEGSVAEAIYALDNLKAAGIIVLASTFGEIFGSPLFEPLYAVLNERRATVLIHPSSNPCNNKIDFRAGQSGVPPYVIDFLLDTTRAAANLLYYDVELMYPNINFILAHSGGFLPFAASRITGALSATKSTTKDAMLARVQRFYVDTAISTNPSALPSTLAVFDPNHIIYGSDFPFYPLTNIILDSSNMQEFSGLSDHEKDQVHFGNAAQMFSHTFNQDCRTGKKFDYTEIS